MADETVKHTIRFPADVYAKLREIAKRDDRSINWEVIAAIRVLIDQRERQEKQDV